MVIGEKKLREMYTVDEESYQPNSIDLRVADVEYFCQTDNVGMYGGEKHFPTMKKLPLINNCFKLSPHSSYIVTIKNPMKIPSDVCQLYFSRSSLMRMGLICTTCVGDSGFNGHLKFLFFNSSRNEIRIELDERIATAVSFECEDATQYDGDFNED